MIPRTIEQALPSLISKYPVIMITGPRQSGKTTLLKTLFPAKPYISFEDPDAREEVRIDPRSFLERHQNGAVFDEVHRMPELPSLLHPMAQGGSGGKFILAGAQHSGMQSAIAQSPAGHTAWIHLLPFSFEELYSIRGDHPSLESALFAGLYPPIHDKGFDPQKWYAYYVQTYIERDVRSLLNIRDLSLFQLFLKMCAARCGQLVNLSGLASDCGITHNTAREWISVLEAGYIVFRVESHSDHFGKRLVTTPKLYFYDPGLATYLLGIKTPEQLSIHPSRGSLFETFVASEIVKSSFHRGETPNLYFWKDRSGNKIDLLIDRGADLLPVAVKSGKTVAADWYDSLKHWMAWAGDRARQGILVYGGDETFSHEEIAVLSWRKAGQLQK
jgi:predicted AAA+ superfamily ATPase